MSHRKRVDTTPQYRVAVLSVATGLPVLDVQIGTNAAGSGCWANVLMQVAAAVGRGEVPVFEQRGTAAADAEVKP